ncbi:MAG: class II aldolase/adducin family protein [Thermoflexales bacterium]|nr:class II aldolase/adducin family protein [Thermoflexales bacterium]MDW8394927.1 class II aldolase/adducin family protein [Anaerolineae bacterium]
MLDLAHHLGEEQRDYAIIGEGNVSARLDETTFLIKASGSSLQTLRADQVARVQLLPVVAAIECPTSAQDLDDEGVRQLLDSARADKEQPWPSVETFFHALLYRLTGAAFIGHTHPVAVCSVLCSQHARLIARHLMPDEIVVCGPESVFVPYTDPGLPLARAIGEQVRAYQARWGEWPRTIYLENHGLIALGASAKQVKNVTAMAVKHARVLVGALSCGGARFLDEVASTRIHTRPDEEVRRNQFK